MPTVDIQTPDGSANAYLARSDEARRPGVLLIMDAFGVRPQIERMADRIAAKGYVVLAPNVFYRHGREAPGVPEGEDRSAFFARVRPLMNELTPEVAARDGGAFLDQLETVATPPFGVVGYCMGGRYGWRVAVAHPERVAALAAFHAGGLVGDGDDSPHLTADRLQAQVYLGHADNDRSMTPEQIETLEGALGAAEVVHRSELYEGAAHGYTMADTPVYDEGAAERHYDALFALLERTLQDPSAR